MTRTLAAAAAEAAAAATSEAAAADVHGLHDISEVGSLFLDSIHIGHYDAIKVCFKGIPDVREIIMQCRSHLVRPFERK